ncbi:MAG: FtsW/RodA/SpoVE family cell cycle protein [Clostridia bacterium]|nr:FtsW/RodA/SpoVE family cell cycle protein [Clostridia bacterium]
MEALVGFMTSGMRYIMLAVVVYVVLRMLLALFFKKTTDPVRGKLVNTITDEEIFLYDRETSLGRNKKCDIVLPFDTISRLHAVLTYRNKGFVVFDTFSKSGVAVNGEKIDKKAFVHHGDTIDIGGLEYTLYEARYKFIKDKSRLIARPSYGIVLILIAVFNMCSLFLNLYSDGVFKPQIIVVYLGFIALQWIYFVFATFVLRIHNFELEMIAFMFTSVGLAIVGSIYPDAVLKQFLAIVIGVVGFSVMIVIMRNIDTLKSIRWVLAGASVLILGATLIIAETTNGAKNWISLGGISLQPSELVKIAFIFVGAVTLEKLQSIKNLTMYIIFSAICVGELFLMFDFGTALIFFFTFIVIAFMRSGDIKTLSLVCGVAAVGAVLIMILKPYVASRFSTYLHVWDYMDEGGYQQTRTLIYSASGGLFGLGLGNGELRNVFAASEDLVFGVVCEEFGLITGFIVPLVYGAIAVWAVLNAQKTKSAFYAIAGVGAIAMMLFQTMLSIFGITDLLPLTGVTLPFVSKGGSSIISCFCLLAYIKAVDMRTFASFKPRLEAEGGGEE